MTPDPRDTADRPERRDRDRPGREETEPTGPPVLRNLPPGARTPDLPPW